MSTFESNNRAPVMSFAPELLLQAQPVKLLVLDVDGVLTDGGLLFGAEGETLKRFHTLDGHGIKLLQQAGIAVAIISGRDSAALRARLHALDVRHIYTGVAQKLPVAEGLLTEVGCTWPQVAVMGDDWPDLPMLARAGFTCAPPQAHAEVLARVHHVTRKDAGAGAVRECCDLLLCAVGSYATLLDAAWD